MFSIRYLRRFWLCKQNVMHLGGLCFCSIDYLVILCKLTVPLSFFTSRVFHSTLLSSRKWYNEQIKKKHTY